MYDISLTHKDFLGFLADFLEDRFVEKLLPHKLLYACI